MPSDVIRGWTPLRVKKTRQNKNLEPGSDPIRTGLYAAGDRYAAAAMFRGFATYSFRTVPDASASTSDTS
jgi:hypothetical protein